MSVAVAAHAPRRRSRAMRAAVALETLVLVAGVAFLVLGRAGFVGSPISYVVVSGHSMEPTFWTGDVVLLKHEATYRKGQVIGYQIPKGGPGAGLIIIHRIIGGNPREGYLVQGDNKTSPDPWRPRPRDVVGREALLVPKLGLIVRYVRTPLGFAAMAGLMTLTIALGSPGEDKKKKKRPERAEPDAALRALPHADELPEWFVRYRSGRL